VDVRVSFWNDAASRVRTRHEIADYLWREQGKWAQKDPPSEFGSLRFWGTCGGAVGFRPVEREADLNEREWYELRRVFVRWRRAKLRQQWTLQEARGKRVRRVEPRVRGRDGVTVLGVRDANGWLPALCRWADDVADWKTRVLPAHAERTPGPRAAAPARRSDAQAGTAAALQDLAAVGNGLVLVGRLDAVEPVTYGASHARAGRRIAGMRAVVVRASDGVWRAGYFITDRASGAPSPMHSAVEVVAPQPGDLIGVAVACKVGRAGSVVLDALDVQVLGRAG